MEEKRTLLAFALMMVLWTGYVILFPPEEPPVQPVDDPAAVVEEVKQPVPAAVAPMNQPVILPSTIQKRQVVVDTETMRIVFSSIGGTIQSIQLKGFNQLSTQDGDLVELFPGFAENQGTLAFKGAGQFDISPLTGFDISDERSEINLAGDDKFALSMVTQTPGGLQVEKTFILQGHGYGVELNTTIQSLQQPIQGQLTLDLAQPWDDATEISRYNFIGPIVQETEDKTEIAIDDIIEDKPVFSQGIQWAGFVTKYFLRAVAPLDDSAKSVSITKDGGQISTLLSVGEFTLIPGQPRALNYSLFLGPRDVDQLEAAGHGFDSSMDFGIFAPLAQPLLVVLKFFYTFLGNFGWSIILLTIIIKMLFWPLTQKSYTSMKAMQKLQPEMAKLREKYSKDKQRLNTEMMALYKEHRVNPMGGCLPMLIQIPVFFALYKVLLNAIELRHAPFMMWITDLSAADTLFTDLLGLPFILGPLPLIMGFTMFLQQKMTPSTMDPTQAKIFMMMPVVFTFMFLSFPSGLVIYWMVNNILTIVQQILIRRAD